MDPIREACMKTLEGLQRMIPLEYPPDDSPHSVANAVWMIETCIAECHTFPIDKLSRWIGFIQGVLACNGLLDVKAERDRTRPFFHEAYAAMGQAVPSSQER